jgi:hypothetical protein
MEHYETMKGHKLLDGLKKCSAMMLHAKSKIRIRKPLLYRAGPKIKATPQHKASGNRTRAE